MSLLKPNAAVLIIVSLAFAWFPALADYEAGAKAFQTGDYTTAFRELIPLATQGNAAAQAMVGFMYSQGEGVSKDEKEAIRWLDLSIAGGDKDFLKIRDTIIAQMTSGQVASPPVALPLVPPGRAAQQAAVLQSRLDAVGDAPLLMQARPVMSASGNFRVLSAAEIRANERVQATKDYEEKLEREDTPIGPDNPLYKLGVRWVPKVVTYDEMLELQEKLRQASKAVGKALTNGDVLNLKRAGFTDQLIVAKINSVPGIYRLDVDDLLALKKAGLSDAVIAAMLSAPAQ